jgi:hypothetical protein
LGYSLVSKSKDGSGESLNVVFGRHFMLGVLLGG